MLQIGGALDRYRERNGVYPEKLADLYPVFLEKQSMLHCPADSAPGSTVSYSYARPTDKTSPDAIGSYCKRHSFSAILRTKMTLVLRKNGKIDLLPEPPAPVK